MSAIREAASVILLRAGAPFDVFLLRRHRGASFMASSYVFPGGAAEPGEGARSTAARELFEEAGVLLARDAGQISTLQMVTQDQLRAKLLAGAPAAELLAEAGLAWSLDTLVPWSHWITPSIDPSQRSASLRAPAEPGLAEAKRFSARFFVAELPAGQKPQFDATETVDQVWVTPQQALERTGELQLPPPQVRTFWELAKCTSIADAFAAARARASEPHPIMPRLGNGALLLPWDPDYTVAGTGDGTPLTYKPAWAIGPSRFVMEGRAWKHI